MSAPRLHTVHGQPSWSFHSNTVHAHLTQLGGHLGPVTFRLGRRIVAPFSVAPWAEEKIASDTIDLLRVLRGDFFCAPFGGNGTPWKGERHPVHGETANAKWQLTAFEGTGERLTLHATLETSIRRGRVDKFLSLIEGHAAVYQRHVLSGMRGPMDVGHHAMVKFPDEPGSGIVSTSRFVRAQVFPGAFEEPANRGYQSLRPGATFARLDRVPMLSGEHADLTRYPARRGYEDLVMLTADPKLRLAWNAVTFPKQRYVWFALRDPRVLRHTILWISNGGRHYAPWSGRHVDVIGIEDVTAYFHYGLAESAKPNSLSRRGIPTTLQLNPKRPTSVSYIMGVAEIPRGFDRVHTIRPIDGGIELVAASGRRTNAKVALDFLRNE
jgi:hypothetical protein